mgnify:FL=1
MEEKEKEFVKKINIDKAINKSNIAIALITISVLTYVVPLIEGNFDFGMIFEVISLVFTLISRLYMSKYNAIKSRTFNICSIFSVGWILIYDIMIFLSSTDSLFYIDYYDWFEIFTIGYMVILFLINKDLSKADNPEKYKESTDWFYEKYEDENKK